MRSKRLRALIVAVGALLISCDGNEAVVIPDLLPTHADASPIQSASPSTTSSVVSCRGLQVPTNGEVNTNLDRENGILDISFRKRGHNRNVTIRYREDGWCERNQDTWRLILHVLEADESLCLDLPKKPREGMTRVELWFGDREVLTLGPTLVVHRDIPSSSSIAADTLRAWIEGPTKLEKKAGAYASAPDGTELLGIDVDDGTAVVDLSEEFERTGVGTTYEGAILTHLAGTITQFDTIDRALLKIEGEFKDYYMGHGYIVDEEHPLVPPGKKRYRVASIC